MSGPHEQLEASVFNAAKSRLGTRGWYGEKIDCRQNMKNEFHVGKLDKIEENCEEVF
jgi:hypothetical protein